MDHNSHPKSGNNENIGVKDENQLESHQTSDQMNESPKTCSSTPSSTSWWTSLVQKSSHTFESIKRDLTEFKEVVQNESVSVVSNTASYVSQTMKDTISGISQTIGPDFDPQNDDNSEQRTQNNEIKEREMEDKHSNDEKIDESINEKTSDDWTSNLKNKAKHTLSELMTSITDAFVMNRNYYEDEDEMYVFNGDKLVAINNWQQLLSQIQTDSKTYCREPSGPPEHYESWLMTFNLFDYQRQMDHLLKAVPQMQEFYSQLVPNSLSDVEFWHRYYYRVHQLRETERKKIEDKSRDSKESTEDSNALNRNSVEIKLLEENSSLSKSQINEELLPNTTTEGSDIQSIVSTPDSSDTHRSEAGSDDWEKTDIVVSDEDIKDWVKYE